MKKLAMIALALFGAVLVLGIASCKNSVSDGSSGGSVGGSLPQAPAGFVRVAGATVSDGVADSEVFLRGRKLTISALYASDHEVTQGEYEKYCKYGGDEAPSDMCGVGANYPAYYVSWYDAVVYCNLRSKAEGLAPVYKIGSETNPANWPDIVKEREGASAKYCGPTFENSKWDYVGDSDTDGGVTQDLRANGYRLPTEAEWEYLARDGSALSTNKWSGTNEESELSYYAWYKKDGEQANGGHCYEIAKKKPNGLGLYDMSGNV